MHVQQKIFSLFTSTNKKNKCNMMLSIFFCSLGMIWMDWGQVQLECDFDGDVIFDILGPPGFQKEYCMLGLSVVFLLSLVPIGSLFSFHHKIWHDSYHFWRAASPPPDKCLRSSHSPRKPSTAPWCPPAPEIISLPPIHAVGDGNHVIAVLLNYISKLEEEEVGLLSD